MKSVINSLDGLRWVMSDGLNLHQAGDMVTIETGRIMLLVDLDAITLSKHPVNGYWIMEIENIDCIKISLEEFNEIQKFIDAIKNDPASKQ